jgi:hypothetical protein
LARPESGEETLIRDIMYFRILTADAVVHAHERFAEQKRERAGN